MEIYGLYSDTKRCLMAFSTSCKSCNDVEVRLSSWHRGANLWTTPDLNEAKRACAQGPTEWYNASLETPNWDRGYYGNLHVVCLNSY